MLADVAAARASACVLARRQARARQLALQLAGVLRDVPTSRYAQYLHVGLERLERSEQREEASPLAVCAQPLVRGRLDRERRPAVVEPFAEHAVPVNEGERRPHARAFREDSATANSGLYEARRAHRSLWPEQRVASCAPRASATTCPCGRPRPPGSSRTISRRGRVRQREPGSTRRAPPRNRSCSTLMRTAPGPV